MENGTHGIFALTTNELDPLDYLHRSAIIQFRKGQTIYARNDHATRVYLIITGKVLVSRITEKGRPFVVDIYRPNEFFGETALVEPSRETESAVAMENTKLMSWSRSEIEERAVQHPELGLAMLQMMARRSVEGVKRLQSSSLHGIAGRLAEALIRFSSRLGEPMVQGKIRMIPVSHDVLARHIGTSREIVTQHMNAFRSRGCLDYSRHVITVCRHTIEEFLNTTASGSPNSVTRRLAA